jgi:hypothetical protein
MGNSRFSLAVVTALLCAWATPSLGEQDPHRQHAAHVHGAAELLIAVEGETLEIEFRSPALNLVGFEHRPATAAQRQAVSDVVSQLQQGERLFRFPTAARCALVTADIASPLTEYEQEHEHEHEHEHDDRAGHEPHTTGSHSDFTALYRYRCQSPAQLRQIEVALIAQFPAIETIATQSVSPHGQRQAELSAAQTVFEL